MVNRARGQPSRAVILMSHPFLAEVPIPTGGLRSRLHGAIVSNGIEANIGMLMMTPDNAFRWRKNTGYGGDWGSIPSGKTFLNGTCNYVEFYLGLGPPATFTTWLNGELILSGTTETYLNPTTVFRAGLSAGGAWKLPAGALDDIYTQSGVPGGKPTLN